MLQHTVITSPHLQDIAAEGGVLGSILLDRSVTQAVRDILPAAEAFTRPEHQTLYRVLTDLAQHNKAWDLVLIADGLKQHKALKAIGGVDYLVKLAEAVPTAANAAYYARIVRDKYLLRQMAEFGTTLANSAALGSLPGALLDMETQFRDITARYRSLIGPGEILSMRPVSEYTSMPIDWLWPGRFPLGMLSLIAGIQGHGKSFLMCYMAAVASQGYSWPDRGNPCAPMEVAILSDEESVSYALRPRLEACGADLSRVFVLDGLTLADGTPAPFDISTRLSLLDDFLEAHPNCRLMFFDSLAGFLGHCDPNDNAAVRRTLGPLSELAERRGVAMVGILHLNKKPDLASVHRISGASAFTAVARAVWLVVRDEDAIGNASRLLLPVKCNYADTTGLRYRIVDGAVAFETEPVAFGADSVLAGKHKPDEDDSKSAVDIAADWLRTQLENQPPKMARELFEAAETEGISLKTLYRAKSKLNIEVRKIGFQGAFVWSWNNPLAIEPPLLVS